jgi:hypothetical protein
MEEEIRHRIMPSVPSAKNVFSNCKKYTIWANNAVTVARRDASNNVARRDAWLVVDTSRPGGARTSKKTCNLGRRAAAADVHFRPSCQPGSDSRPTPSRSRRHGPAAVPGRWAAPTAGAGPGPGGCPPGPAGARRRPRRAAAACLQVMVALAARAGQAAAQAAGKPACKSLSGRGRPSSPLAALTRRARGRGCTVTLSDRRTVQPPGGRSPTDRPGLHQPENL